MIATVVAAVIVVSLAADVNLVIILSVAVELVIAIPKCSF